MLWEAANLDVVSISAKGKIFGPFINRQYGGMCKICIITAM